MEDSIKKYLESSRLKNRLRHECYMIGRIDDFEDIYQAYYEKILKGHCRKQLLRYFVIDYSRDMGWVERPQSKEELPQYTQFEDWKVDGIWDSDLMVWDCLKCLKERERTAVILRFKYNLLNKEVADALHVSDGLVSQILKTSIAKLEKEYGNAKVVNIN